MLIFLSDFDRESSKIREKKKTGSLLKLSAKSSDIFTENTSIFPQNQRNPRKLVCKSGSLQRKKNLG